MLPDHGLFLKARDELCARIVAARSARFGRHVHGDAFADDASMMDAAIVDADLDQGDAPPLIFHLIYRDAKSDLTGRGFKLRKLDKDAGDVQVRGVCFLRHAYRSFLASRIVEITDLATGEVFEDGAKFFKTHPLLGLTKRQISEESKAVKAFLDELIILAFVAASDGEVHALELDEMIKFVCLNWSEPLDEMQIALRINSFAPDTGAFMRALERICQKPARARGLRRGLRAVIDADKRLHPNELSFAEFVLSRLDTAKASDGLAITIKL